MTLIIKAMRVVNPPLRTSSSVVASGIGTGSSGFVMSSLLEMPAEFGQIYCGEQFSCYVHISNGADSSITDVKVRVAIKCGPEQHQAELLPQMSLGTFSGGNSRDFVVRHTLQETGSHLVECVVTYVDRDGQTQKTKKTWPFDVLSPLKVESHVCQVGRASLVQLTVTSLMSKTVFLEQIDFDHSPSYEITDLNPTQITEGNIALEPQCELQLCYQLVPGRTLAPEKDPGHLGSLQVRFRGCMGSLGEMKLNSVRLPRQLMVQDLAGIQVSLADDLSRTFIVGEPTQVTMIVRNCSSSPRKLCVELRSDKMVGVLLNGISGQMLGEVSPDSTVELRVDLLPLQAGIQTIGGVQVLDVESFQRSEFGEIGVILAARRDELATE